MRNENTFLADEYDFFDFLEQSFAEACEGDSLTPREKYREFFYTDDEFKFDYAFELVKNKLGEESAIELDIEPEQRARVVEIFNLALESWLEELEEEEAAA